MVGDLTQSALLMQRTKPRHTTCEGNNNYDAHILPPLKYDHDHAMTEKKNWVIQQETIKHGNGKNMM